MAQCRAARGRARLLARALFIVMSLLVSCGPAAEQSRDHEDLPERVAAVMEHELDLGTLWVSEEGGPEQAAEEFLEHVLGWTIDVSRFTEHDDELAERFDDPDVDLRRRIGLEAQSPDGRPVGLWVQPGEPTRGDGEPEDPTDERWRVHLVGVGQPYGLTLEEDTGVLGVHEIPEELFQSVLLLYVGDETEALLLDDGELEPGAEADDLDLSTLGVDSDERVATGLVVHFDDDGRTLGAEGGTIYEPRPSADRAEDDLPEVEPEE
jgi:hypothetical protein